MEWIYSEDLPPPFTKGDNFLDSCLLKCKPATFKIMVHSIVEKKSYRLFQTRPLWQKGQIFLTEFLIFAHCNNGLLTTMNNGSGCLTEWYYLLKFLTKCRKFWGKFRWNASPYPRRKSPWNRSWNILFGYMLLGLTCLMFCKCFQITINMILLSLKVINIVL